MQNFLFFLLFLLFFLLIFLFFRKKRHRRLMTAAAWAAKKRIRSFKAMFRTDLQMIDGEIRSIQEKFNNILSFFGLEDKRKYFWCTYDAEINPSLTKLYIDFDGDDDIFFKNNLGILINARKGRIFIFITDNIKSVDVLDCGETTRDVSLEDLKLMILSPDQKESISFMERYIREKRIQNGL